MDEAWLRSQLESGRSIESIARETGRAASTVAYWVNKHGLVSRHAAAHAARGGIDRDRLATLIAEGGSIRAIAARLDVSYATVRYWIARHGLSTPRGRRLARPPLRAPRAPRRSRRTAPCTASPSSSAAGRTGSAAGAAGSRRSDGAAARSSGCSWPKPAAPARSAATTVTPARSSSITWTPSRRPSGSRRAGSYGHSIALAPSREVRPRLCELPCGDRGRARYYCVNFALPITQT